LIKKIYEIDPLTYPKCQGRMKIKGFIEDEEVIQKILKPLGLWDVRTRLPPRAKGTSVTINLDDSEFQTLFPESFYAHMDYPVDYAGFQNRAGLIRWLRFLLSIFWF